MLSYSIFGGNCENSVCNFCSIFVLSDVGTLKLGMRLFGSSWISLGLVRVCSMVSARPTQGRMVTWLELGFNFDAGYGESGPIKSGALG